ncbi:hypothetical protein [Peribacillus glennii]|uniref:hypothetical protein n=1 Tax=Peribacillus glennii TaxID=2303991 RepID=UPI001F27B60C|nr:hypothetical protein [Peribacillus glennii]
MKRNQQVVIYSKIGDETVHTLGKVNAIGRDFVMVTNLKDRIWIPYQAIESANIPQGVPNFSNSHQYFIYDNDLKRKLLYNFGETVSKRDALIQQFYEESFATNLRSWKDTWVKIRTETDTLFGKIKHADKQTLLLSLLNEEMKVELKQIAGVQSIRFLSLVSIIGKKQIKKMFQ